MTKQTEALTLALEALEWNMVYLPSQGHGTTMARNAITAANEALAQPKQEPDRSGLTYYRNDKCEAVNALSPDCICWTPMQPAQQEQEQTGIREIRATETVKQEQKPAVWMTPHGEGFRIRFSQPTNDVPLGWDALYTTPPKREWVDLTDDDLVACSEAQKATVIYFLAKLKKKNT